jgi:hypothetical protein
MKPTFVSRVLLVVMLGAPIANAAPPANTVPMSRRATAAALFEQGMRDINAGKTAEGCDKLAEGLEIVPDTGVMVTLAECNTALGRLGEAWELWRELASSAPTTELREDAAKIAAELDARLARVAIHVRGGAPANLVVTLNGKAVRALEAGDHRVTPGTLTVIAASPQVERWTQTFDARQGETVEIAIPIVASQSELHRRQRVRQISLSLVGAGTVALGVGAVYGGAAYIDSRNATESCGGSRDHCASAGYASAQSDLASARRAATISSWSTAAGLGAAAAGLIVYLALRDPPSTESAIAWRASPMTGSHTLGVVLTRRLP